MLQYHILCGNFDEINFVYAIKSDESDWNYFDEKDCVIDSHSFGIHLENRISLNKISPVALDSGYLSNYILNGKFSFKGKELKTCKILD